MRTLVLAALVVSACTFTPGTQMTYAERVLVLCTSWVSVFDTVTTRRQLGLAKPVEIDAINSARPILNPVCEAETPVVSGEAQLLVLERALIKAIQAQGKA